MERASAACAFALASQNCLEAEIRAWSRYMHLDLDQSGDPESQFIHAVADRRLDLVGPNSSGHLRQVISSGSRTVARSAKDVLDALQSLPTILIAGQNVDSTDLRESFRRLVYDVTELLDVYAQMVPQRLQESGAPRAALADYRRSAKRLRDPWAIMCNKFKHSGSRLAYNRAVPRTGMAQSHGFIFLTPKDGDALMRDDQVQKPPERRTTFVKSLHEMLHAILRADLNAAKLVACTPDAPVAAEGKTVFAFPFGDSIRRLCRMPVYVASERVTYDGLLLPEDGTIRLERLKAIAFGGLIQGTTQIEGDGHTKTFTFQ